MSRVCRHEIALTQLCGKCRDRALEIGTDATVRFDVNNVWWFPENANAGTWNADAVMRRRADGAAVEAVNHPAHYGGDTPYEVIKVLQHWLTPEEYLGFVKGNTLKYLARQGKKGAPVHDAEKADWYCAEVSKATYELVKHQDEAAAKEWLPDEERIPRHETVWTYQQRVREWLLQCMGAPSANDLQERRLWFMEEAIELFQACGGHIDELNTLKAYVYTRAIGVISQEVGGVSVTLAALCGAVMVDQRYCAESELKRCIENIDVIREKQKKKPANIKGALT